MKRRILLACALAVAVVTTTAGAASAASVTSDFKFVNGNLRAAGVECDTDIYYVCGIGVFEGRDAVTRVELPTNQRLLLDQGCALYDTIEVITLRDGSGELTIEHLDALVCGPNPQWLLHAPATSFGNPFRVSSEWSVVDGSGVYEGATGSGTWNVRWAGGAGSGGHTGSLS